MQEPTMQRLSILAIPTAALALVAASLAHADTRSDQAVPKAPAEKAQGPKNGFPDNHGMEVAMEHANEHARFIRNDSDG